MGELADAYLGLWRVVRLPAVWRLSALLLTYRCVVVRCGENGVQGRGGGVRGGDVFIGWWWCAARAPASSCTPRCRGAAPV